MNRDPERDRSDARDNVLEEYIAKNLAMKLYLRQCVIAFEQIPDTEITGSRGLTTRKIAENIKTLLNN